MDLIWESSLRVSGPCGVQLLPGSCLMDMEYADDIVLLGSDPSEIQIIINNLNNATTRFGMRLHTCKV